MKYYYFQVTFFYNNSICLFDYLSLKKKKMIIVQNTLIKDAVIVYIYKPDTQ